MKSLARFAKTMTDEDLSHEVAIILTSYRRSVVQDIKAQDGKAQCAGERGQKFAFDELVKLLLDAIAKAEGSKIE